MMNGGGAQEALLRLSRQLRERGHDMSVWFLYRRSGIHENEPFTRLFLSKAQPSPLDYVRLWFRLVQALRAERPEVVIGFLPLANVFGLSAALVAGVPHRIASHRSPADSYGRLMRLLDRLTGGTGVYRRIVCVSDSVRRSFAGHGSHYRDKLAVIHNGIEWTPSPLDKAAARAALGLPAEGFLLVSIGRLNAEKNIAILIDALAHAQHIQLAVAGGGPLRAQLEEQAARLGVDDRLFLLGELERQSLRHLLRAADAFALASLYEGQSNALLEAMNEGLPIIVSDIPANRETVVDETSGEAVALLADARDTAAWSTGLCAIRDDAALREGLAARGNALVNRRFSLQRMIDRFEGEIVGETQAHG
jgi:L-malate glycosyltransferase